MFGLDSSLLPIEGSHTVSHSAPLFPFYEVESHRRPPNAFILFSQSTRASVQLQHPGLSNIEYTKIMAEMWKAVPEEERHRFKQIAADLQSQFKLKNPNYGYRKGSKQPSPFRTKPDLAIRSAARTVRGTADDEPFIFRWDQMLNNHGVQ
jgi:hypothetical protein